MHPGIATARQCQQTSQIVPHAAIMSATLQLPRCEGQLMVGNGVICDTASTAVAAGLVSKEPRTVQSTAQLRAQLASLSKLELQTVSVGGCQSALSSSRGQEAA